MPSEPSNGSPRHIRDLIDPDKYSASTQTSELERDRPPPDSTQMQAWFSIIYQGLTPRFRLKGVEITIVANVLSLSRKSGWCYASEATLAKLSAISIPTLEKHLRALHGRSVLEKGGRTAKGVVRRRLSAEAREYLDYIRKRVDKGNKR